MTAAPISAPWGMEELAHTLEATGDYRVLRRFVSPERYGTPGQRAADAPPLRYGLILDQETTGLEPDCKPIELGLLPFTFDKDTGVIYTIGPAVSMLEDPGFPLPEAITELTGLTDADLAGKKFDDGVVEAMSTEADVIDISTRLNATIRDQQIDAPKPGIYPGTPIATYHRWRAASNSFLTHLHRSPAHAKAAKEEPIDTEALTMGRAIHAAILEPDEFQSRYVQAEQCGATKKGDGLRCTNMGVVLDPKDGWLCGVHGKGRLGSSTVTVIPGDRYRDCLGVRDAVYRHSKARDLLTGEGQNELSLVWNDPATGVPCKSRPDRFSPVLVGGVIVDVKKTRDARARAFERSIFGYGYHRQGALYLTGAEAHKLPNQHFVFLAVEDVRPYGVALYRLTEGAISAGEEQLSRLLPLYQQCVERNEWPGYSEEVVDIALPAYAWDQIDQEISE